MAALCLLTPKVHTLDALFSSVHVYCSTALVLSQHTAQLSTAARLSK